MFWFGRAKRAGLAVLAAVSILAAVSTQSPAQTGSIHITLVKAGIARGGSGSLFYRRGRYRLGIAGIDTGALSVARADLTGRVTNLNSVRDVLGPYHAAQGASDVAGSAKTARLQNAHGVTLELRGSNSGPEFSIDLAGMTINSRGWQAQR
jgi:hypothetical protein